MKALILLLSDTILSWYGEGGLRRANSSRQDVLCFQ